MRGQYVRNGRGDQAVEQHEPAVRYRVQGFGEAAASDVVGPGPGARNRVLVHAPAERGEPAAHVPVVDIAAAGSPRVVDTRRNDDVDGVHSSRS